MKKQASCVLVAFDLFQYHFIVKEETERAKLKIEYFSFSIFFKVSSKESFKLLQTFGLLVLVRGLDLYFHIIIIVGMLLFVLL